MSESIDDWLAKPSLAYEAFLAERKEILNLKWIESEKEGKDIGFEEVTLIWMREHRKKWREAQQFYQKLKNYED